jgi:adenylate kinase
MIVFVCGISKSGKTSVIEKAALMSPGWQYLRASRLIGARGGVVEKLEISDVLENQTQLIQSILDMPIGSETILDGHLLIETVEGPQLVPDDKIDQLPFSGVVLIEDDILLVVERRREAHLICNADEVSDLMAIERVQARRLARRKKIPMKILNSHDGDAFAVTVAEMFRNSA